MKNERSETMLTRLQSQLEEEKQTYRSALTDNKEFWALKIIKEKIRTIEKSISSLKNNMLGVNSNTL